MNPELINAVADSIDFYERTELYANTQGKAQTAIKMVMESEDYQQLLKDLDWSQRQYQSDQETIYQLRSQLREREWKSLIVRQWVTIF